MKLTAGAGGPDDDADGRGKKHDDGLWLGSRCLSSMLRRKAVPGWPAASSEEATKYKLDACRPPVKLLYIAGKK